VVFGSARALSPEELTTAMEQSKAELKTATGEDAVRIKRQMVSMETMCHYYAECEQLAEC